MPRTTKALSRGERNIAWIEHYCYVPEGKDIGKPMVLRPWQRQIIIGIYDNPAGTRRAIISFARKNGKTALAAMIMLLHLAGPEARPNSQLFSCAQSREQAAILYALASKVVRLSPDLNRYVSIRETAKQLYCTELGSVYKALSAETSTAYGLSPTLVIFDELSQVKGPRSPLFEAMQTASAAHQDPLTIVISTQAATDADLLSILIDDAKTDADPKVKLFLWSADEALDPFSDEAIKAANPAAGDFQSADELRSMAEDARRMPSREAEWRNLCLNQRVEALNPFISKTTWDANGHDVVNSFHGYPVYIGLDLSSTSDLTALVAIAEIEGIWHVKPTFWLPEEGLVEKSRKDRVPWDLWAKQGFLQTTTGKAIEYSFVAEHLRQLCNELDVRAVAFDRWGMRFLKPWLSVGGFTEGELTKFIDFGQGFQSMAPALRETETVLLNEKIAHGNHPILTFNAANAVVETDPAGNRKLSKARSRGKIDGMVCLAMALSVATTVVPEPVFSSIWDDPQMMASVALNSA